MTLATSGEMCALYDLNNQQCLCWEFCANATSWGWIHAKRQRMLNTVVGLKNTSL